MRVKLIWYKWKLLKIKKDKSSGSRIRYNANFKEKYLLHLIALKIATDKNYYFSFLTKIDAVFLLQT